MSEHKKSLEGAEVSKSTKGRQFKLKPIVFVIILVLLIGSAIGIYLHHKHKATNLSALESTAQSQKMTTSQEVNYLSDNNDYSGAEKVLENQLSAATKSGKVNVYASQAFVAIDAKQYADAQTYANKAISTDPTSNVGYDALASAEAAAGNKQAAKGNWQKAIKYLDKSDPRYDDKNGRYQQNIKNLGL